MALTARFEDALILAMHVHMGQKRKGSEVPYVSHVLGVAGIALEYGANEDEVIAALLHDAPEDQGGQSMLDCIRARFGTTVADIVSGCTDTLETPKPPWKARKEEYIRHVETASPSIVLVSASDKLHNARAILSDYRAIDEELWSIFNGGKDGTLWYYGELVKAFRKAGSNTRLVADLHLAVSDIERLASRRTESEARAEP